MGKRQKLEIATDSFSEYSNSVEMATPVPVTPLPDSFEALICSAGSEIVPETDFFDSEMLMSDSLEDLIRSVGSEIVPETPVFDSHEHVVPTTSPSFSQLPITYNYGAHLPECPPKDTVVIKDGVKCRILAPTSYYCGPIYSDPSLEAARLMEMNCLKPPCDPDPSMSCISVDEPSPLAPLVPVVDEPCMEAPVVPLEEEPCMEAHVVPETEPHDWYAPENRSLLELLYLIMPKARYLKLGNFSDYCRRNGI